MTLLNYVLSSYEHHFPETVDWCRYRARKPDLFWRIIHALHTLGFLRLHTEGGFFRDGEWTWRFWEPIYLHSNYWMKGLSTFCPYCGGASAVEPNSLPTRFRSAWCDLRGIVVF